MSEQEREWWFNSVGDNLLKGVEDDESNPIRLSDASIVDFLSRIPAARDSFERVVPQMLPEEQERLARLAHGRAYNLNTDSTTYEDQFQATLNRAGIRTTGPRGGGGWYPPPMG